MFWLGCQYWQCQQPLIRAIRLSNNVHFKCAEYSSVTCLRPKAINMKHYKNTSLHYIAFSVLQSLLLTHVHVHTSTHTCIHICTCIHVCMRSHTHTHARMHTHTHEHTHTHTHAHTHARMHARTHTHTHTLWAWKCNSPQHPLTFVSDLMRYVLMLLSRRYELRSPP